MKVIRKKLRSIKLLTNLNLSDISIKKELVEEMKHKKFECIRVNK